MRASHSLSLVHVHNSTVKSVSPYRPLTVPFVHFGFAKINFQFTTTTMKTTGKGKGRLPPIIFIILLWNMTIMMIDQYDSSSSIVVAVAIKMELIHRHSPKLNPRLMTQLERIRELLHNDIIRQNYFDHNGNKGKRRLVLLSSQRNGGGGGIEMPVQAGRDYGTGMYFVEVKVGRPSQKLRLILDTGNELSWINCRYHHSGHGKGRRSRSRSRRNAARKRRRVFNADVSSSFKTDVTCLSELCKKDLATLFSLALCPTPTSPCAYDYRYTDGSSTKGIFAKETFTLGLENGRKTRVEDVLIGCSDTTQGPIFTQADGVLGLAYANFSFAQQLLTSTKSLGGIGKFSYCLVDHLSHKNVSSYLTFGGNESSMLAMPMPMRFTLLGLIDLSYAVNVKGISIAGVMLNIPNEVWDVNKGAGTAFDSGTTLTFLVEPAYKPVMAALERALSSPAYRRLGADQQAPFEYCFNSSSTGLGYDESSVPKLVFHFVDGARFEPHKKSYIIDVADGIKCIGIVSAKWPGVSTIGNIMQQNYFWEFDLVNSRLGFAPSTCT